VTASCGGGEGAATTNLQIAGNSVVVEVTKGVNGDYVNGLFTTVTVCSVGTQTCFDVDNVLVDTGSTGLRLMASAIPTGQIAIDYKKSSGLVVSECSQFVSGIIWGALANFDIKLGNEIAPNTAVQIIGAQNSPSMPNECASKGQSLSTAKILGANGILGISNFLSDCGVFCESLNNQYYYGCDLVNCISLAVDRKNQVLNPIANFSKNNNGSVIQLPEATNAGDSTLMGLLIFGIDTESNNSIAQAKRITLEPTTANFTTIYKSYSYQRSYLDSGSNGIYFDDLSIPECSSTAYASYYCPSAALSIDVILKGVGQEIYNYTFLGDNAEKQSINKLNSPVQPTLMGSSGGTFQDFVWGLPFFYGKKVFTPIEGTAISSQGIFSAYQ
jgi:hypothetical protein